MHHSHKFNYQLTIHQLNFYFSLNYNFFLEFFFNKFQLYIVFPLFQNHFIHSFKYSKVMLHFFISLNYFWVQNFTILLIITILITEQITLSIILQIYLFILYFFHLILIIFLGNVIQSFFNLIKICFYLTLINSLVSQVNYYLYYYLLIKSIYNLHSYL